MVIQAKAFVENSIKDSLNAERTLGLKWHNIDLQNNEIVHREKIWHLKLRSDSTRPACGWQGRCRDPAIRRKEGKTACAST
jgi:hypothetical protein